MCQNNFRFEENPQNKTKHSVHGSETGSFHTYQTSCIKQSGLGQNMIWRRVMLLFLKQDSLLNKTYQYDMVVSVQQSSDNMICKVKVR